jgi:hypothetical protein
VGCIGEPLRVILDPRSAAPLVEEILHIRITSAVGPVLVSERPVCAGQLMQEYSVQVLGIAPGGGRTSPEQRQIFMSAGDVRLDTGQEYLALLWPDGNATEHLVFPIVSVLVASPSAGELNGMRVDEALKVLGNWSQERPR